MGIALSFSLASQAETLDDEPFAFLLRDFDGDGLLDAALSSPQFNETTLFRGNGNTFTPQQQDGVLLFGAQPLFLTSADFDLNGRLDLASADHGATTATVLLNEGITEFLTLPPLESGSAPFGIVSTDANRDGQVDLAVTNFQGFSLSLLLNNPSRQLNGAGQFEAPEVIQLNGPGNGAPFHPGALAAGDLNRDGRDDLLVTNPGFGAGTLANTVFAMLSDGFGGISQGPFIEVDRLSQAEPVSVALGDLNRDGILDFAVVNRASGTLSLGLGDGTGSFSVQGSVEVGGRPESVSLADLDRDGALDVLVANSQRGAAQVFLGDGQGAVSSPLEFACEGAPVGAEAADINRDGALDLVVLARGRSAAEAGTLQVHIAR